MVTPHPRKVEICQEDAIAEKFSDLLAGDKWDTPILPDNKAHPLLFQGGSLELGGKIGRTTQVAHAGPIQNVHAFSETPVSFRLKRHVRGMQIIITIRSADLTDVWQCVMRAASLLEAPQAITTSSSPKHGGTLRPDRKNVESWYGLVQTHLPYLSLCSRLGLPILGTSQARTPKGGV